MGVLKANKEGMRELYIAELQAQYPFYTEGSRPLELAYQAVDAALSGKIKLAGECWERVLRTYSLPLNISNKSLAKIPATAHSEAAA